MTVTRDDISLGYQAVQSIHAAIQFTQEHPEITKEWYTSSNYLVSLSVKDEKELQKLAHRARDMGLEVSMFHEPDIGNQLTAIAIQPSEATQWLIKRIPLLFKNKNNENL